MIARPFQAYAIEVLAKCHPDVLAVPGAGEQGGPAFQARMSSGETITMTAPAGVQPDSDGDDAQIDCVLYVYFEPSKRRFHVDMSVEFVDAVWLPFLAHRGRARVVQRVAPYRVPSCDIPLSESALAAMAAEAEGLR